MRRSNGLAFLICGDLQMGANEFYFFDDPKSGDLRMFSNPKNGCDLSKFVSKLPPKTRRQLLEDLGRVFPGALENNEQISDIVVPTDFFELMPFPAEIKEKAINEIGNLLNFDMYKLPPFSKQTVFATGYTHIPAVMTRLKVHEGRGYNLKLDTKNRYQTLFDKFRSWNSKRVTDRETRRMMYG